jgi:hypothetical protein
MGETGFSDIAYDGGDAEMYEAGHAAWSTLTAQLIGRFQMGAQTSDLRRAVDATIIELASQQLWNDHAEQAAWDRFEVERWSDSLLELDGTYRRRARSTLSAFFKFLASVHRVRPDAWVRIHHEIESRLGDHTFDGARDSSMRFTGDAMQDPQAPELVALAKLRQQR